MPLLRGRALTQDVKFNENVTEKYKHEQGPSSHCRSGESFASFRPRAASVREGGPPCWAAPALTRVVIWLEKVPAVSEYTPCRFRFFEDTENNLIWNVEGGAL